MSNSNPQSSSPNDALELYESDGQWFLYVPGPKEWLGQHYDSANFRLPKEFDEALAQYIKDNYLPKQSVLEALGKDESQGDVHLDDGITDFTYKIRNQLRQQIRDQLNLTKSSEAKQ